MPKAYLDFKTDRSSIMDGLYENVFTITSREDYNTITSSASHTWRISTDGGITWDPNAYGTLCTLMKGQSVMIMGRVAVHNNTGDVPIFNGQYTFDVSGNIRSLNTEYLIDLNNPQEQDDSLQEYAFRGLLKNSNVVDASKLKLPDTTLAPSCYKEMFYGCSNLKNPPVLPATNLSLADDCYEAMFAGCSSLVYAPALPATTLSDACYGSMFEACISLREAPQLPAGSVPSWAYASMFKDCTALQTAPQLPALRLTTYCYYHMFDGCTSLTTAPELPAINLPQSCYAYMFANCSNLSYIKIHAENREDTSLTYWVENVADFGIFVKSPFATYDIDSPHGVPIGWTIYDLDQEISDLYNVTVIVSPPDAGYVIGGGLHRRGSTVILKALPYEGYVFNRWTDASYNIISRSNTYSFTLNEPIKFYAMFITESDSIEYDSEYFTIESEENDNKVYIDSLWEEADYELYYKINNGTWNSYYIPRNRDIYTDGTIVSRKPNLLTTLNTGDKLYIGTDLGKFDNRRINVEKRHKMYGNVLSLIAYSGSQNSTSTVFYYDSNYEIPDYAFSGAFADDTTLTDAHNLIIPDVVINEGSFSSMFRGCTSLLRAPSELYPSFLDEFCYENMFKDCTSLVEAPELPSTTMERSCYQSMFTNCTSLVEAPELPATTLAYLCYNGMFAGCTSLLYAPDLDATTLAESCYQNMFYGCTSLTEAPELPALTMQNSCYRSMFQGCTGLIEAPELPATTLAEHCYDLMFAYCTFSQAPLLLASNVPYMAYSMMFLNNPNLNYIYILATQYDESSPGSLFCWVEGVAPTGIFVKHPDTDYLIDNINGVPPGWTILNYDDSEVLQRYVIQLNNANPDAGSINMYIIDENEIQVDLGTRARIVEGTTVYLEATPNTGYSFSKWQKQNGTQLSNSATYSFEVTESLNLTAIWSVYSDTYYTVTITNNNPNMGTVTGAGSYKSGTMAYISAIPVLGYSLDKIVETTTGQVYNSTPVSFTVTRDMSFTVYWKEQTSYENMYFTIENNESEDIPVTFELSFTNYDLTDPYIQSRYRNVYFEYKLDTQNYWRVIEDDNIDTSLYRFRTSIKAGGKISIRNCSGKYSVQSYFTHINIGDSGFKHIKVYGNILSLYKYYTNTYSSTDNYFVANNNSIRCPAYGVGQFEGLLSGSSITDASKIIFPNRVARWCYEDMFRGCSYLTKLPSLPATTLSEYCYASMFRDCVALISIPNNYLPATNLGDYCYYNMFFGCTSLVSVPSSLLSATTLTDGCYSGMFYECTSLTTAPILPATTLINVCYAEMFYGCTSLNYVKAMFTSDPATMITLDDSSQTYAYTNAWLQNVASSGTFVKNSSATWTLTGASGIPSGWTVQTA